MVSDEHKVVFVHIPRTGGTSIEKSFGFFYRGKNIKENIEKHLSSKQILKSIGINKWNKYFKFSFVRNPWDYMVSIFSMPNYRKGINIKSGESFKHFLSKYKPAPWEKFNFHDYINKELDFVGKFENREKDLKIISKMIGFKIKHKIHWRKTDHKHYSYYYDEETKSIVYEMFKEDILKYNYSFENNPH